MIYCEHYKSTALEKCQDCNCGDRPELPQAACSAFEDGQLAYRAGLVVGCNPHKEDTDDHWQWMAGWANAGMQRAKANLK